MKDEFTQLARRYVAALTKHLKAGRHVSLEPALKLGRQTVAARLETLDLARIHEQAFTGQMRENGSVKTRAVMTRRAGIFFKEANSRIEQTQSAAAQATVHMNQLTETLGIRTAELATANRQLERGVVERKIMEEACEKRRKLHSECLEESLQLQKRLRQLTHRLLTAQEDERKNISRELRGEIAQTLLGINVRLLSLKVQARGRPADPDDLHLRSTQSIIGYELQASDGVVGSVTDFLVDDYGWMIRHLGVETGNWFSGKEIWVSPQDIVSVSFAEAKVFVRLTKATIMKASEKEEPVSA